MNDYVLAVEGELTADKRLVRPGAFTWTAEPMPVYGQPRNDDPFGTPIIGTIESIRRVEGEDGRSDILARISWFGDEPTGEGLCASVDAVEADYESGDDHELILTHGRIRQAFLGLPAWPSTVIGGDRG